MVKMIFTKRFMSIPLTMSVVSLSLAANSEIQVILHKIKVLCHSNLFNRKYNGGNIGATQQKIHHAA